MYVDCKLLISLNTTSFGNMVFAYITKFRWSSWIRWALTPMTCVLIRRERFGDTGHIWVKGSMWWWRQRQERPRCSQGKLDEVSLQSEHGTANTWSQTRRAWHCQHVISDKESMALPTPDLRQGEHGTANTWSQIRRAWHCQHLISDKESMALPTPDFRFLAFKSYAKIKFLS